MPREGLSCASLPAAPVARMRFWGDPTAFASAPQMSRCAREPLRGSFSSRPGALPPLQCKSFRLCGDAVGEDSSRESARERERALP